MAKKKVYVCFDYEKDRNYKYLMEAWDANPNFDFSFNDRSPREIQSDNISVIKGCLSKKINEASYTVILAGEDANKRHADSDKIGYVNWQNFEVAQSVNNGNKLVVVRLKSTNSIPEEALGQGAVIVNGFTEANIIGALNEAAKK